MSGFDVSRADAHRTRGLVAAASLSLSAILLFALMTGRESQSEAATLEREPVTELVQVSTDPATIEPAQDTERERALEPPGLSPAFPTDIIALNTAAFADCVRCATTIQVEREVPRGGTLAGLLDDSGIDRVEAARAISALNTLYDLRYLRAGQNIRIYVETTPGAEGEDDTLRLNGLSFRPDVERSITVARTWDGEYRARETIAQFEREMVRSSGEITTSLYVDALNAGATDRVVVELAGVLAYAIDFQRSIQPGDGFDIVFERFVDEEGETARTGDILYARYEGRGEPKEFFRYETPDGIVGYYSSEGASAQRLLMLTPINGARLSSHFSRARRHPILGYTRRHNGTDFAAPRGTPVYAAGNGVIERADRYGSFGNYVRIRHANGYQTAYAHLNGFARGMRAGTRVTQGQVIAYVGTTGRSTGPHLHYEVHHNGTPVNPMTLDLPTGRQLNEDEIPLFEAERDRIIAIRDAAAPAAEPSETPLVADAGNGAQ
ncbi:M23 family metallopeptidase [Maricaulis parjimensis]|uniref:M23 family metallopeptidase n=1 Tax=Maricaulis parjimensis TaxID=144023 RepID=UPI00193A0509|nr:M23 family metallopeptidase [Maricaulis parjimensis]